MARAYWLMKSEPELFSIDALRREPKKTTGWSGVRNYQARNFMRAMKPGDQAFFYHSNAAPPGIAGIVEIVRAAFADPTQFDPKSEYFEPRARPDAPVWDQVDVRFARKLRRLIALEELRSRPELATMALFTRARLSVMPVTPEHWSAILGLAA